MGNNTDQVKATIKGFQEKCNNVKLNRPELGALNFQQLENYIKRLFKDTETLLSLPLEYLANGEETRIQNSLNSLSGTLDQISSFQIQQDNPTQSRTNLINQFTKQFEQYLATIPLVIAAIKPMALEQSSEEQTAFYFEQKKEEIAKVLAEVEELKNKAKEGVGFKAVKTAFNHYTAEIDKLSIRPWLVCSVIVFCICLLFIGWSFCHLYNQEDKLVEWSAKFITLIGLRITIASFLIFIGVWLLNQYQLRTKRKFDLENKILALQSFDLLVSSTKNESIQSSITAELSRYVFSAGYFGNDEGKTNQISTNLNPSINLKP